MLFTLSIAWELTACYQLRPDGHAWQTVFGTRCSSSSKMNEEDFDSTRPQSTGGWDVCTVERYMHTEWGNSRFTVHMENNIIVTK